MTNSSEFSITNIATPKQIKALETSKSAFVKATCAIWDAYYQKAKQKYPEHEVFALHFGGDAVLVFNQRESSSTNEHFEWHEIVEQHWVEVDVWPATKEELDKFKSHSVIDILGLEMETPL